MRVYSHVIVALLAGACAFAQPEPHRMGRPGPGDFAFMGGEFGFARKVVTGAPYSAQVVTQSSQTLADGNRIQRSTSASVARDSEGRTRSERTMGAIGTRSASGSPSKAVFIHDPVAGMSYVLDPGKRVARQMQVSSRRAPGTADSAAEGRSRHGFSEQSAGRQSNRTAQTVDLGIQTMEGVAAQGKRVTRMIPANRAGSERDIEVVTETWYSPDLQVVVMSKTSDPRFGESIYKLTNISRGEPDHSLFAVPSDYSVQQGRPPRLGQ